MPRMPLRWKLPLLAAGLPLLVAGVTLWAAHREVRHSALEAARQRLDGAVSTLSSRLATQFRAAERRVRQLAADPALARYLHVATPFNRDAAIAALDDLRAGAGSTVRVELLDLEGRIVWADSVATTGALTPGGAELRELVAAPESAGVGAIRPSGDTLLVYPVAALVADRGGAHGHLVVWQRLATGAGESQVIADLVGADAAFYLGSAGGSWTDQATLVAPPAVDHAAAGVLQRYHRPDGDPRLAMAGRVVGSPWSVVLEFPEGSVLAPARRFLGRMSVAALAVVGLGLAIGLFITRQVTGPLGHLMGAAEAMSAGRHDVRVAVRGRDEPGRLAAAFNLMAERVDAEVSARARAEDQWRLLFKENPHPMWVFDLASLRFLAVNEAAIDTYGYSREEFLAMTIEEIRPSEDVPTLHARLTSPQPLREQPGQFRHRRRDGSLIEVEIRSRTVSFDGRPARLVLAQDVTARATLEAAFRQAQKMEAVGRLAGGIAHDFNNLLAVIMTYTELVREELPPGDSRAADLGLVADAAGRAHALTRQLLAFSRQQVLRPVVIDPNESIDGVELLLRRLLGEDIVVRLALDPAAGRIRIDPGQFEQVLMNLVVNARDAMPVGGTLDITSALVEVDEASRAFHGLPAAGKFTVITVSDTGVGMAPEVKSRLFEPFFTTKEAGKGTGLGLATAYGIVAQAGGNITVYSEPGMGATFRVYLPAVDAGAEAATASRPARSAPRGAETILLVEDDAAVRSAAAAVLERLGYAVLQAQGAEAALALIARHGAEVRLVLSDVVMPGVDGLVLAEQLRRERPGLRVLLMSGYPGEVIARRGVLAGDVAFLEKPFTSETLGRKVREVLDQA